MPLPLWPTRDELKRMAFRPSRYGPTAAEVLTPGPLPSPKIEYGPDERRLMDAILKEPGADEPRLKFAEFIESSDPARADFIRAQLQGDPGSPDPRWTLPFHIFGARDFLYRRGFIEGMSLTARSFLAHSDAIFAATPLREVRFVAYDFFLEELFACENLKRLDPKVLERFGGE